MKATGVLARGRWPLCWKTSGGAFRAFVALMIAVGATYDVAFVVVALGRGWPGGFGDSFALWSWGRFLGQHPAPAIYDPSVLRSAQLAMGLNPGASYPFSYPPSVLPVLWLLGRASGPLACVGLMAVSLPLLLWAITGSDWRRPAVVAALAAPATAINIVAGQTGFLEAALLAGGLRLATARPILSGVLLGLATYKPQLGLLVPVGLIAARAWRAAGAAATTAVALAIVTSALFGPGIWSVWLEAMPRFSSQVVAESSQIRHLMPTVEAALLQLGAGPHLARMVQLAAGLAAAVAVWRLFRAGVSDLAVAGLLVGALLATPYAFVYDLVLLTPAVVWFISERQRPGEVMGAAEILIVVAVMAVPVIMVASSATVALAPVWLLLLLGAILTRAGSGRPRPQAALGC